MHSALVANASRSPRAPDAYDDPNNRRRSFIPFSDNIAATVVDVAEGIQIKQLEKQV